MSKKRIAIIGGGASGMFAAITAARAGAEVLLLEHNDRIGKKILATGNGRCNLTNLDQHISYYNCTDRNFVNQILEQFGMPETVQLFSSLGLYTKNRNGYLYPNSDQASAVLDVMRFELERLNVMVICGVHVTAVEELPEGFRILTDEENYEADACIIACGGKAGNISGADGSGYVLARSLGHEINPVMPALVQLRSKEPFLKHTAGIRVYTTVSLYVDDKLTAQDVGELQFTSYGISGIPVFQISRHASEAFRRKQSVRVNLNFLPDFEASFLDTFMEKRIEENGDKTMEQFLVGLLHKKLGKVILDQAGISLHKKVRTIGNSEITRLKKAIQRFPVILTGTNTYREAQVCAGGIPLIELKPLTLESVYKDNLYFAGEVIDVDGACGGYNLQWAWSSGYAAGYHAAQKG